MGTSVKRPKLSMLQLLRMCKKYGISDDGITRIANETGKSERTISRLIYDYCIIPNLAKGGLAEDI
ncbi:MAG TPA: hypothetical protein VF941_00170 [Clostridia bacterium]